MIRSACLVSAATAVPESILSRDDFIQFQKDAAEFAIGKLDTYKDAERLVVLCAVYSHHRQLTCTLAQS